MVATSSELGVPHSKEDVIGELAPFLPLIYQSPGEALSWELPLRLQ